MFLIVSSADSVTCGISIFVSGVIYAGSVLVGVSSTASGLSIIFWNSVSTTVFSSVSLGLLSSYFAGGASSLIVGASSGVASVSTGGVYFNVSLIINIIIL